MADETTPETSTINTVVWESESIIEPVDEPFTELDEVSIQLSATTTPAIESVTFSLALVDGDAFPMSLSLSSDGLISGILTEMDDYVPEFVGTVETITKDGSNYATTGSAAAGSSNVTFTIRATATQSETFEDRQFSMLIYNNWSSDRDQLIRDYAAEYGEKFTVNGVSVTAEEFLTYQKSQGFYIP